MENIKVWVDVATTTGYKEMFKINLPKDTSIHELYKLLKLVVDMKIAGVGVKQSKGELWKYQLITKDMKSVVNKTSLYLKTDDEYSALVNKVEGKGKETPIAVLTQEEDPTSEAPKPASGNDLPVGDESDSDADLEGYESTFKEPGHGGVIWDDSNWEEPLDEDGKPFFDPIDPEHYDRVCQRYGEQWDGPINEEPWAEMLERLHLASKE